MTESDATGKKTTRYCTICQGTGFHRGQICICITGKSDELPKEFKDIFGDIFRGKK